MQVMRQLCTDAHLIHFLFVTYDAREVTVLAGIPAGTKSCLTVSALSGLCLAHPPWPRLLPDCMPPVLIQVALRLHNPVCEKLKAELSQHCRSAS